MRKTLLALALLFAAVTHADAEWGMYENKDNKGWVLTKTFAFEDDCRWAAREAWRSGRVLGAGCKEYIADFRPTPQAPVQAEQQQPGTGRGRKEADVDYYKRVLESAQESARSHSGGNQRTYSNGDSYNSRAVKDAQGAYDRAVNK